MTSGWSLQQRPTSLSTAVKLAPKHISSILYCTKNKCSYLRPLKYACHKLNDGKLNVYLVNNSCSFLLEQEFVRPRWPYDMRPSVRAEKYIRDAGP